MGLNSDIKAKILGTWSPKSYHIGTITIPNAVRIVDAVVDMYHHQSIVTGDQAYMSFLAPIQKAMMLNEYMYAVVCDNQAGVPAQKRMTQDERRKANSFYASKLAADHPTYVKYEDDCTFDDLGIIRPSAIPSPEPFLLCEVIRNSKLRLRLMHYYCQRLVEYVVPPNRILRFDYDHAGPWYFTADNAPFHCLESSTRLGEYDITANCIALKYNRHPLILQTVDTDTIPLVVSLMYKHDAEIAWIFAPGGFVDCKRMVEECLAATGLSSKMFILGCVLCGTDFYKKTWLSHWFNDDAIFSALRHPHCAAAFVGFDKHATDDYSAIRNFVLWLHTARLKSKPDVGAKRKKATIEDAKGKKQRIVGEPITSWDAHGPLTVGFIEHVHKPMKLSDITPTLGLRYRIPSEADLATAQSRIQFNLWYWTRHWLDTNETFEQWRATITTFNAKDDAEQRKEDPSLKSTLWTYDELSSLSIERAVAYVHKNHDEWDQQHPGIDWSIAGCVIQSQSAIAQRD